MQNKQEIDSLGMEFGYELKVMLPWAYYLYKNGRLKRTISAIDTKHLYYFSPDHQEKYKTRRHVNLKNSAFPNKTPHAPALDWAEWTPPPFKDKFYIGRTYDWIIFNKYTEEWGGKPINFLSVETLDAILELIFSYDSEAKILYSRMTDGALDHQKTFILENEDSLLEKYKVEKFEDINCQSPNKLKMELMAGCDRFISVQGGASVFASYFGKKNFIFVKKGSELVVNSYQWFSKFSWAEIIVSQSDAALLNGLKKELKNDSCSN